MVALLLACTQGGPGPLKDRLDRGDDTEQSDDTGEMACKATLQVHTLDAWGQPLNATVDFDRDLPDPIVLGQATDLALVAWKKDHLDHRATLHWDGDELSIDTDGRALITLDEGECDAWGVFVAVEHAWFASSARPWSRNRVDLLMDGEQTWERVEEDVLKAQERVSWATWWWESDFLLTRPWGWESLELLEAVPAEKKLLINRFWGENSDWSQYLNTDSALRDWAQTSNDGFDVILQGNPTDTPVQGTYTGEAAEWSFLERALEADPSLSVVWHDGIGDRREDFTVQTASYHQKFIVIDGEVAFISGMNTKEADWDTNEHPVEHPDRTSGPRKDYAIRVEGPAVRAVEEVMHSRWEHAIDNDALYADRASSFSLFSEPSATGVPGQVLVTLPEPWAEMSIMESWIRALSQATEYIFIEDQYFRAPILNEVIADRMLDEPGLVLIVVTQDVSEWDPGLKYSYLSEQWFEDLFEDRFLMLTVGTFDIEIVEDWVYDDVTFTELPINLHSKLRIIDDRYVSVGSCNFNNRGLLYEGEMDFAVLDEDFATESRERVFENLVGPEYAGWLTGDVPTDMALMADLARYNREVADYWTEWDYYYDDAEEAWADWNASHPSGFLLPLDFSDDYIEVGPDLF